MLIRKNFATAKPAASVSLLVAFFTSLVFCEQKRFDGDQVLKLMPKTEAHLRILDDFYHEATADDYDFWSAPPSAAAVKTGNAVVRMRVAKDKLASFTSLLESEEFPFSTAIEDVQKWVIPP